MIIKPLGAAFPLTEGEEFTGVDPVTKLVMIQNQHATDYAIVAVGPDVPANGSKLFDVHVAPGERILVEKDYAQTSFTATGGTVFITPVGYAN